MEQAPHNPEAPSQPAAKQHGILLFYQYAEVAEVPSACAELKELCSSLGLSGRIRVSFEGFNGNLSGSWPACEAFRREAPEKLPALLGTDFKLAPCRPEEEFRGLKVWESQEVCGLFAGAGAGRDAAARDLLDSECGTHLTPSDWHEALAKGGDDMVLFDCRNLYETRTGRFSAPNCEVKWVDPATKFFKDLPSYFENEENLQQFQGKKVMMYCTGGVRCERASALLKQKLAGSDSEVFQLEGGIQRYMDSYPQGGFFQGTMHVFDKRGTVGPEETSSPTLGRCVNCQQPWGHYQARWRCSTCDVPVLACPRCQGMTRARAAVKCEVCAPNEAPVSLLASQAATNSKAKVAGPCAEKRAEAVVRELVSLASAADLEVSEADAMLERLKGLSGGRKLRSALHHREGLETAAALRKVFDRLLPTDPAVAGKCVEVLELWLCDRPELEYLHRVASPSSLALQLLESPELQPTSRAAALRCPQRLVELQAARSALESEASRWLQTLAAHLEPSQPVGLQTEACETVRALAEHLPMPGLFSPVLLAARQGDARLCAAALSALWAMGRQASAEEVREAVQAAAAVLQGQPKAAEVHRWGCSLLLLGAEQGEMELLRSLGAVELVSQAESIKSPPTAKAAARLRAALQAGGA